MSAGRPSKLTAQVIADLETAIRLGASDQDACGYAGIDRSTYYKWMQRGQRETKGEYVDFVDRVTRARTRGKVTLLATIEQAAKNGDWRAAAWKLERRDPSAYGPLVKHRVGGDPDGVPIEVDSNVTDAELIRELSGILDAARTRAIANDLPLDPLQLASESESEPDRPAGDVA